MPDFHLDMTRQSPRKKKSEETEKLRGTRRRGSEKERGGGRRKSRKAKTPRQTENGKRRGREGGTAR